MAGKRWACASHKPDAVSIISPTVHPTKIGHVLALLRRDGGATMPELIAATGWLAHTTRAALTGLRKKGHAIATGKRGDATCYTIPSAA